MIDADLDDRHLCIKCRSTIVGLDAYIEHRKTQCTNLNSAAVPNKRDEVSPHAVHREIISTPRAHLDHTYDAFAFVEPAESYTKHSPHGGKTSKSLTDAAYELPYELGADVFFSSLQLQSVQATGHSTSGKQGLQGTPSSQQRQPKIEHIEPIEGADEAWMTDASASGSNAQQQDKSYEVYKPITFEHESPEASEDDEDDVDVELDDDDDDYDPIAAGHASGGKWKPPIMPHSPPVVPATHTGGKWRPEQRPILHVTHTQLTRLTPPHWDEAADELVECVEAHEGQHPPAEHTKGKWIPGTKMQRLEYKEEVVEHAKSANQEYWCNICCRRLKNKTNYENHLKTGYHLKRAEPELQLEKAALGDLQSGELSKSLLLALEEPKQSTSASGGAIKKRKRRAIYIKCQLCKHSMLRHLVGKHLISHYHYRRMQMQPAKSLHMILEHIHSIVLQSPFQCRPCHFYANTEETFLQHWSSSEHLDASEGMGKFWCSYCHFECEDNNQMRRHLLSTEHKEVIFAINRSVPICISKKLSMDCTCCRESFRYNAELRRHMLRCHPGKALCGTAADSYQCRFPCELCVVDFRSKVALQRHEKNVHSISKYFCSICKLEFNTPCKARRHRKTAEHRNCAAAAEKSVAARSKCKSGVEDVLRCDKCDFIASSEVEAMLHELSHPKCEFSRSSVTLKGVASINKPIERAQKTELSAQRVVKCKDCEEFFPDKMALSDHRDVVHPLLRHVCLSCGESFASAQTLGRHTRLCQPKASTSKAALAEAIHEPPRANKWSCEACDFSAAYESELIFHRLHHTYGPMSKNQVIACPICSKEFRKHSLRCHLRQHTNEKIFVCELCDMKFSRRHNLKDHIKRAHEMALPKEAQTIAEEEETTKIRKRKTDSVESFACSGCTRTFNTGYMLKKHSATHVSLPSGSRENSCSYEGCKYVAANATLLRIHAASHAEEQLKCKEPSCKYEGKSLLHLKRHSRSHLEPTKLYACDKCNFKARIKGHIKRHMRSHTGEKPYSCPYCTFRCSTFDNLRKHVLKTGKHPGKFIYECQLCSKGERMTSSYKTNSYQEFQAHNAEMHASMK